jgi:hypothetical protein
MTALRSPFWCTLLLAAPACATRASPSSNFVRLGGDVAHVADAVIPATLVDRSARSRMSTTSRALDGLVEDALLAQEAATRGLDHDRSVLWMCTTALARVVGERLLDEARLRGSPSDDELATIRVMHAVVRRSPSLSPSRAVEVTSTLRQAVENAKSDDDFETRAKQVPHPGAQVTVERLDAIDASGRSARGDEYDPSFVAAAFGLHVRGETTDIVETPFGWHVIRLMDRAPPEFPALEQRRQELATDVVEMRVRAQLHRLLEERRKRTTVEVRPNADDLMANAATAL